MSSWVRFAAMMPARRAVPSTSPFFALPLRTRSSVFAASRRGLRRWRSRSVADFAETSTMWASPREPKWVSFFARRATVFTGPMRARVCASAMRASPRQHLSRASGFRRPGRPKCRPWPSRARSSGVKMPLSPTMMRSSGHEARQPLDCGKRGLEGFEIAVVDAEQPRFQTQRARQAHLRRGLRSARPCRARTRRPRVRPRKRRPPRP